jgi:multidrug efflux pump subunit AcrB
MIGMIALAGIIVRNSILLVDFIRLETARGVAIEDAVIRSAATRAQPILLTGAAATLGAFFILDDPIFNGLAISLIFGIVVSTVLTLVVIPLLYYVAYRRKPAATAAISEGATA